MNNMAQFQLNGFAIVVGAAGGVGKEVGLSFAEAGAKGILFADIDYEAATKVAEASKALALSPTYRALSVKVDVVDVNSVQGMIDLTAKEFGRIDYCINAAGVDVAEYVPFDQTDPDDYDRVLGINTKGIFLVTRAVAKFMQSQEPAQITLKRHGARDLGRGSIVNVSSAMALVAVPNKVPYTTSKHAITGLTRACAMDYKSAGIRCNQVCPVWIRTPMLEEEFQRVPETAAFVKKVAAVGRPLESDEVASACVYLCSPSAVYINGTTLTLDSAILAGPIV
ncbi:NAD(P)-binding protein [Annulohypoxylon maeteangense]|uniref:NAD(P)-binding protein n=1 Tax=Annulohypoxylon maeteangense TaxID=1927788 RepID=UPI0020084E7C|nr:NAD(P)-binding protein [Annulohypoxylon maeteangense]KAI0883671.1 NAD(P)-binding protein [Annulohypoxylon maeteangense]